MADVRGLKRGLVTAVTGAGFRGRRLRMLVS